GFYASASLEEGGAYAGGAFQYEKLVPEVRGYVPLGSRVTLAARAQFGQIFSQGDLGSPVTRRFYLGGPSSHRGFNYGRLSRQVPSGLPGVPPIPIGGDQMLLLSGELRVELFKIAGYWLSLAAFVDGGDVSDPSCNTALCRSQYRRTNIDITDLHWATGGGLRYKTVIGTIRADLGVRLNRLTPFEPDGTPNPDPGQRFAFHLSVGEAF
ncbi:MAG TPA: BamA/TamA family outer membrane protein, partial [Polyangia bacterium]